MPEAARLPLTLLFGAAGGAVAHLAGMPAGWLLGSMLATLASVLCGFKPSLPNWLRDITLSLIHI